MEARLGTRRARRVSPVARSGTAAIGWRAVTRTPFASRQSSVPAPHSFAAAEARQKLPYVSAEKPCSLVTFASIVGLVVPSVVVHRAVQTQGHRSIRRIWVTSSPCDRVRCLSVDPPIPDGILRRRSRQGRARGWSTLRRRSWSLFRCQHGLERVPAPPVTRFTSSYPSEKTASAPSSPASDDGSHHQRSFRASASGRTRP
jgi:hypothetical protein